VEDKNMSKKIVVGFAILVLASLVAAPVIAAWGGALDGDLHPMVGALYFDWDANGKITDFDLTCSGSYAGISSDGNYDVFLTAGHCLAFTKDMGNPLAYVSFDNNTLDGVEGVIPAVSYAWDPEFGQNHANLHDLGIVLLPFGSVEGIQPVELPPEGYMDKLLHGAALKDLNVEAVGYGVIPIWQQPGGTQYDWTGLRNMATTNVKGLTHAYVLYNQNYNATGDGGVCYGDSGSPQFIAGSRMIISVTSGGDAICRANNYNYRVDTSDARNFLGQYLHLP
jgi:hypothetical protein